MSVPISDKALQVYAGQEWRKEVQLIDADDNPFDLSNFDSFKAQWRVSEYNPVNVHNLEVSIVSAENGTIQLAATPEQTNKMRSDGVIDVWADNQPLFKIPTQWEGRVTK